MKNIITKSAPAVLNSGPKTCYIGSQYIDLAKVARMKFVLGFGDPEYNEVFQLNEFLYEVFVSTWNNSDPVGLKNSGIHYLQTCPDWKTDIILSFVNHGFINGSIGPNGVPYDYEMMHVDMLMYEVLHYVFVTCQEQ